MIKQISMFDGNNKFVLNKPIRLIELFGGYGSQALALKYLGIPFEYHRLSEWAVKSIQAYKDIHVPDDNTDYSKRISLEELRQWLYGKISADYNTPMTEQQINRLSEKQVRTVYNNMQATHNVGSIMKITADDLEIIKTDKFCYIMTYSFPCFTADSLVLTDKGYKPIVEINCGDMVLTHDNTYQRAIKTFNNGTKKLVKINAMAVDEIKCTHNHKFYVRSMKRVGNLQKRTFSQPYWKQAQELTKSDYLGIAINQNAIVPTWNGVDYVWSDGRKTRHKNTISDLISSYNFWWIIGRYIGDGWQGNNGVVICCAKDETEEIESKLNGFIHYTKTEERTIFKYIIPSKEWIEFVSQFGKGAVNKHLTNTIIDLPQDLLKGFLDGYMSADGCFTQGLYKATTISRELAYGLAQCIAKVYKTPYRIYRTERPKKYIIENRIVNQHDTYQLVWKVDKRKQDKAFYENGFIWFPINRIDEIEPQNVYDIEVENNHSFTVQNTIVHNCQDLSQAGQCKGMTKNSGTRSGLLWEVERLLNELSGQELPQVLLMENVPQVIGKTGIKDFAKWIEKLEQLGYKNYWQCLNAKDFGIPQNRNRCFMASLLGDYDYTFPTPQELIVRLKDFLDEKVDKKYYLSDKTFERKAGQRTDDKFICEKASGVMLGTSEQFNAGLYAGMSRSITTEGKNGVVEWKIKCKQVGMLSGGKEEPIAYGIATNESEKWRKPPLAECSRTILANKANAGCGVIEPTAYDEQNGYLRQDGCVGILTTDGSSPKHNNRIYEPQVKVLGNYSPSGHNASSIVDTKGVSPTVMENHGTVTAIVEPNYRIRKLTERECFRLMGVKEADYEKVAKNQSMSSLYHLAGDSIVTTCLMAIFGELIGIDYGDKISKLIENLKERNNE